MYEQTSSTCRCCLIGMGEELVMNLVEGGGGGEGSKHQTADGLTLWLLLLLGLQHASGVTHREWGSVVTSWLAGGG